MRRQGEGSMRFERDKKGVLKIQSDDYPEIAGVLSWFFIVLVELPVTLIELSFYWCAKNYYTILNKIKYRK